MNFLLSQIHKDSFNLDYIRYQWNILATKLAIQINPSIFKSPINYTKNIKKEETQDLIKRLLLSSLELCKAYTMHKALPKFYFQSELKEKPTEEVYYNNYEFDSDLILSKEYETILKEYILFNCYYAFSIYYQKKENKTVPYTRIIELSPSIEDPSIYRKHKLFKKSIYPELQNLIKDSYFSDKDSPEPLEIDANTIFNLITNVVPAPFNKEKIRNYNLAKMQKCLKGMCIIPKNLSFCDGMYDKYLLEYIFKFDIVSFLINLVNENKLKKDEVEYLGDEILLLPNLFSRKKLVQDILKYKTVVSKKDFIGDNNLLHQIDLYNKRECFVFLNNVTFPLITEVFNSLICYYIQYLSKNDNDIVANVKSILENLKSIIIKEYSEKLLNNRTFDYNLYNIDENSKISCPQFSKLIENEIVFKDKTFNSICRNLEQNFWKKKLPFLNKFYSTPKNNTSYINYLAFTPFKPMSPFKFQLKQSSALQHYTIANMDNFINNLNTK